MNKWYTDKTTECSFAIFKQFKTFGTPKINFFVLNSETKLTYLFTYILEINSWHI